MNISTKAIGARCPGPSYEDIMRADGGPVSDVLSLKSNPPQSLADIPFARYTSRAFYDLEMEKIWRRVWQFACRVEHIPNPGDYYVYDIGRYSIIVLRSEDGTLKAYANSCLHRGTKLKPSASEGSSDDIQCPYHGWTWNLDGSLKHVPCKWDFPHVEAARFHLPEYRVESWNGFVFVCMAKEGPSLLEYLEVLPAHFAKFRFENWYVHHHVQKELSCNWKIAQEAFMEAYHTPLVHPEMSQVVGDWNMQHDVFGDHISRDLCPLGSPSPAATKTLSQQELVDMMLTGDRAIVGKVRVPEGKSARNVIAAHMRELMARDYGLDLAHFTDSEMIDSIKYNIFPNLFIYGGPSLPLVQQFRPLGDDHERCLFEQLILRPNPKNGPRPQPASPVRIGEYESFTSVAGLDPFVAMVLDQDTSIMRWQHEGMKASEKGAETLSQYQESRIRNNHVTMDKYLSR